MPIFADNVVATSQPLAAQAGLQMLRKGGNAVDAAIATAITLTVVEPTSNGIGSDAFAIVWDGNSLHGINGSGRSPKAWSKARFAGLNEMPKFGWNAVTVPGAVDVWIRLSERFGALPFSELCDPAIHYARDGFPVSPLTAGRWTAAAKLYREFPEFTRTFLPGGRAPYTGERFSCPDQARTLEAIADSCGESFYRGHLAEHIASCAAKDGAALTLEDLDSHRSEWVDPLSIEYGDVHVHEIPPNGQGVAALIALGILDHLDVRGYPQDSADSIHLQIEAMKLAFAAAHRHVADPASMRVSAEDLLDPQHLAEQARQIRIDRAGRPALGRASGGGTVYLTTADHRGTMVSFIQSNYWGFGSGIVIPNTGISLQGRGNGFALEDGHPNDVDGDKRPYHTIIPGFVTRGGRPLMSFGVMGAHMQPQGHVQMIVRILDHGQNPQTACDAPRWYVEKNSRIAVECGYSAEVIDNLARRGHQFLEATDSTLFGGAQLIYRMDDNYCAASDPRKDGQAVGY
jgi:gamma-glutamyltranspeptidase/glutathione hydrolase